MSKSSSVEQLVPLTARWWALVVRGVAAIAFGILTFAAPRIGLLALVIIWGLYAIVNGVFTIVLSVRGSRALPGWGWLLAEGIMSTAAGVLALVWPSITSLAMLYVIASWAILTGVAEIATAFRLRRFLEHEWMLAVSGVLSIVLGVLMAANPGSGVLAVTWMIGIYAILAGALLIGVGVKLRRFSKNADEVLDTAAGLLTRA